MKRSVFLNRILLFLGFPSSNVLLNSCSIVDTKENNEEILSEEEILYKNLKEKTAETGNYLEGKILYVDITNENYSKLSDVGSFVNDTDNYTLLLRNTEQEIKAFSNDLWSIS